MLTPWHWEMRVFSLLIGGVLSKSPVEDVNNEVDFALTLQTPLLALLIPTYFRDLNFSSSSLVLVTYLELGIGTFIYLFIGSTCMIHRRKWVSWRAHLGSQIQTSIYRPYPTGVGCLHTPSQSPLCQLWIIFSPKKDKIKNKPTTIMKYFPSQIGNSNPLHRKSNLMVMNDQPVQTFF